MLSMIMKTAMGVQNVLTHRRLQPYESISTCTVKLEIC